MTEITTPAPFNVGEMPLAECSVLGGVLTASHEGAKKLQEQYINADITDPRLRRVDALARTIVVDGGTPSPLEIVAEANRQGTVLPQNRRHLGRLLADLTDARVTPHNHVPATYAHVLVHDAVRRRIAAAGVRLQEAAQKCGLIEAAQIAESETQAITVALARLTEGETHDDI